MVCKFLDKKSSVSGIKSMPNKKLANELHKPNIKKIYKKKSAFFSTIFGVLNLQIFNQ